MNIDLKASALTAMLALATIVPPAKVTGQEINNPKTEGASAVAIIEVPRPMAGSLMHLAGFKGRGTATVRIPLSDDCRSFDIFLVAGGFWGMDHDAEIGPVRMTINDRRVVKRLARGHDIVSDEYVISNDPDDHNADIVVERGLPEGAGFILDTTRFRFGGLFAPRGQRVSCAAFTQDGEKQTAFAQ